MVWMVYMVVRRLYKKKEKKKNVIETEHTMDSRHYKIVYSLSQSNNFFCENLRSSDVHYRLRIHNNIICFRHGEL